jgi:membrane dipeptidase
MNASMQTAWNAALDILKPSKKELERGLALHRESIVFDAYGFSPQSPIDGGALCRALEEGASCYELHELAEEMAATRHIFDRELRKEYAEAWETSGVTCVFQNAGREGHAPGRLIKRFARYTYSTDMIREVLNRASLPEDIEKTKKDGKHCLYLTTNGVPQAESWNNVQEEMEYIRIFQQLGCRMMHMTYNRRNMIGDGCAEPGNAGLSDYGREVVKEMNRFGVICDVAHSGWNTSREVAECSSKPVVSSHSICAALNNHMRSKPDDVIKAIADTGGYNGICAVPGFVGGNGDINNFLDHIDYMIKKFGPDYVAIGTDNGYTASGALEERRKVISLCRKSRALFESFWPEGTLPLEVDEKAAMSLAWTNWPLFTVGLVQRGHSDDTVRKVIGGNVMRVISESIS